MIFLFLLLLLNLGSSIYGFYVYLPQLLSSNILFWLVIPDCPVFSLLFSFLLFLKLLGKPLPAVLVNLVFIGLLKFSFWTVFVMLSSIGYVAVTQMFLLVLLSHIVMGLQAFLLIPFLSRNLFPSIVIFFAHDFVDYFFSVYPFVPNPSLISFLSVQGYFVTLLLAGVVFVLAKFKNA